jgi:hypothetical protein
MRRATASSITNDVDTRATTTAIRIFMVSSCEPVILRGSGHRSPPSPPAAGIEAYSGSWRGMAQRRG